MLAPVYNRKKRIIMIIAVIIGLILFVLSILLIIRLYIYNIIFNPVDEDVLIKVEFYNVFDYYRDASFYFTIRHNGMLEARFGQRKPLMWRGRQLFESRETESIRKKRFLTTIDQQGERQLTQIEFEALIQLADMIQYNFDSQNEAHISIQNIWLQPRENTDHMGLLVYYNNIVYQFGTVCDDALFIIFPLAQKLIGLSPIYSSNLVGMLENAASRAHLN